MALRGQPRAHEGIPYPGQGSPACSYLLPGAEYRSCTLPGRTESGNRPQAPDPCPVGRRWLPCLGRCQVWLPDRPAGQAVPACQSHRHKHRPGKGVPPLRESGATGLCQGSSSHKTGHRQNCHCRIFPAIQGRTEAGLQAGLQTRPWSAAGFRLRTRTCGQPGAYGPPCIPCRKRTWQKARRTSRCQTRRACQQQLPWRCCRKTWLQASQEASPPFSGNTGTRSEETSKLTHIDVT
jgi:hypothetical protein